MASGTRSQRHLLELGRPTSGGVRPGGGGPVADTRPPVITSISAINLPENTKLFHILAADEIVTWSIVGGADASKFEIILGSVLRFAGDVTRDYESPDDANLDRIYVVQLRAVDFAGNPATQIFTVTITDVDDVPPVITSSNTGVAAENTTLAKALTSDKAVTWAIVGGADRTKFDIANNTLRWGGNATKDFEAPDDADLNNVYVVQVQATDALGNKSTVQTISVSVTDVADTDITPPTITSTNTATVPENATLAKRLTADESPVTWAITGGPDAARFDILDDILRWLGNNTKDFENPNDADLNNVYVVQVRATDSAGNPSLSQTISVTVTDVADTDVIPPTITSSSSATVPENSRLAKVLTASEPVTWTIIGGADAGKFDIVADTLRWLNNTTKDFESPDDANADNTYVVQVRATDLAGNPSAPQTISVVVTDVVDTDVTPPVISTNPLFSVLEGQTMSLPLTANEPVTWSITGGADANRFEISGNILRWSLNGVKDFEAPNDANFDNAYIVQVTAKDASNNVTNLVITVTVTDVDEGPPFVLSAPTYQTPEAAVFSTQLVASKLSTWTIIGGADAGKFTITSAGVLSLPAKDFDHPDDAGNDRSYNVIVRATDTLAQTGDLAITVTITDVVVITLAPALTTVASMTIPVNTAPGVVVGTINNKTVGSTLVMTNSSSGKFALNGVDIVTTAVPADTAGTFSITIREAHPGAVVSPISTTLNVSVTATVVVPPQITSSTTPAVVEDVAVSLPLTANETGGTYAITGGADAALFEIGTSPLGSEPLDFDLPEDANGDNIYEVEVTFTSSVTGLTDVKLHRLTVQKAVADTTPPVINTAASATVAENAPLAVALTANETVTWTLTGGADQSRFEISGTTLRWTGNTTRDFEAPVDANADNVYVVQVTAKDAANNTTNKTISVTVTDVLEDTTPPTITTAATASIAENSTLAVALTANESATWSITGGADAAKFAISGSTLQWAGNGTKNFEAPDDANTDNVYVVQVTATDPSNNASNKTISVTVTDVAEGAGPTITSFSYGQVTDLKKLDYTLSASVPSTFAITGGADAAKFSISGNRLRWVGDGLMDYENPTDADFNNIYVVNVEAISKASGVHSTAKTIEIAVTAAYRSTALTFTNFAAKAVLTNTTLAHTIDSNPPMTYAIFGGADAGQFEMSGSTLRWTGNGTRNVASPADFDTNNVYAVSIRGTHASLGTATQTDNITVVSSISTTPPVFTTPGATWTIAENSTLSAGVDSTTIPMDFRITGGADAHLFFISNLNLQFFTKKNFELPEDHDQDNRYEVEITATDIYGNQTTQATTVIVTDIASDVDTVLPAMTPAGGSHNVYENLALAIPLTADKPNVTWTLTGGADAAKFEIFKRPHGTILRWLGNATKNFEAPDDADTNNIYTVIVTVTDALGNVGTPRTFNVTVIDQPETGDTTAPTFTSNGTISLPENTKLAYVPRANEPCTFSMIAGTDSARFEFDGNTLRFLNDGTQDFETPLDTGADNTYQTTIRAVDAAGNFTNQTVIVTITDVGEGVDVPGFPVITNPTIKTVTTNTQLAMPLTANEPVVWSLGTFGDSAQFEISGSTLRWLGNGTKNFSSPTDGNADNNYIVDVRATDLASNLTSATIFVTVVATADTTGPTITSVATKSVAENATLVHFLTANESVYWAITGGADAAKFEIQGTMLRWFGNGAKDFEAPNDANLDNVYVVQVTATDGAGNATNQTISVTVTDVTSGDTDTTPPTVTTSSTASVPENSVLAISLTANESVTWSITGGADATKFEISGSTLRWAGNGTKNFEGPDDANLDNVYVVQVTATDTSGNPGSKTISVTVTDVVEGVDVTPPTIFTSATASVTENAQLAVALAANESVTWTISGGADASKFEISGTTLRWVGNGTKDFESPNDANLDNVYVVQVTATDLTGNPTNKTISVTVTDITEGIGVTPPEGLNLYPHENDLTTAPYVISGGNIIANADGVAEGMCFLTGGSGITFYASPLGSAAVMNNQYRFSIRVKKPATNGVRYVFFGADETNIVNAGAKVAFDLDTNSVVAGTEPTAANCSAGVFDDGSGYKMCWLKYIQKTNYFGYNYVQPAEVPANGYSEIGNSVTPNQYWKTYKLENLGAP